MRTFVIPMLATILLSLPAGVRAADLALTDLRVSVGWNAEPSRREPVRVVYVDRDDRDDWKHRRHERRHAGRHERRRHQDDDRIVIIDRPRHRHCDDERVVVVRPGTRVIIADGRRW